MKYKIRISFFITPARLFMDRLRYAQKFILLGAIFIAPLFVSSYLLVSEANDNVEIRRQKFIGIQHIYNLHVLLRDVQQHRGVSSALLEGAGEFAERRRVLQGDIARDMAVITDYYGTTYGAGTGIRGDIQYENIAQEFDNVITGWDEVKMQTDSFRSQEESFRAHTDYIRTIMALIKDVGDISGFSTDENLVNKYVAGMIISTLMEMSEQIGQSRAHGLGIPQGEEINDAKKHQFTVFSSLVKKYIKDLDRESRIILQEHPEMEAVFAPKIYESTTAVSSLLDIYEKEFIVKEKREISNDTYWDISTGAIDSVFGIYDALITTFTIRTNVRVEEITRERNIIVGLSSGALFLAIYSLVGFYMGVRRTLMIIQQTTNTMLRDGVYRGSIPVTTYDELGDIAQSFNKIIIALGSVNSTLVRANSNLSESIAKKKKAEDELRVRVEEVDKFNRLMIGRELKMIELKEEILKLKETLGEKGGGV